MYKETSQNDQLTKTAEFAKRNETVINTEEGIKNEVKTVVILQ